MSEDVVETFLLADTADRVRLALDPANADALRGYFGDQAFREYAATARRHHDAHLSAKSRSINVLFLPGVMGSLLQSTTKGGIWWVDVRTRKHIDDLRLSPDGKSDADPDNQIAPCTSDPSYEAFLTAVLARDDFCHSVFPYDWRKSLRLSADRLRDMVLETHRANGGDAVHLVAHSMGGLLVRTALMLHGAELWPRLGRIVFIGTPQYGSPAIAGYLKNHLWGFDLMAVLGLYLSRETFRSMRGVLGMLPAPQDVYPNAGCEVGESDDWFAHPCANFNFYRTEDWKLDLSPEQNAALQKILDEAAQFHRDLHAAHQALSPEYRQRMLIIAGVGYRTLFRLEYRSRLLGLWESMLKVTDRVPNNPDREGDGRVPLRAAMLDGVEVRYVKGVHGALPNIPEVWQDVFLWLKDQPLKLPSTARGALSAHMALSSRSEVPHLDGSAQSAQFSDDPGWLDLAEVPTERLEEYQEALKQGGLQEFSRVRLL
jgi:pimeloyl-ACP methyl ester carboxylesterase